MEFGIFGHGSLTQKGCLKSKLCLADNKLKNLSEEDYAKKGIKGGRKESYVACGEICIFALRSLAQKGS